MPASEMSDEGSRVDRAKREESPNQTEVGLGDSAEVVDVGELEIDRPPFDELATRPAERTRALLAYLLLALLSAVILVLLLMLGMQRITSQEFGTVAGVLIAPIVGLLGAATGYYYGKGAK